MAYCRSCRGTGRITERGRHYGDPSTSITCPDCFDAKAAQSQEDLSLERHKAALRESDILMTAHRLRKERDELRQAIQAARETVTFEINPSNYDHDQVCLMNNEMCEADEILRAALEGEYRMPRQAAE